MSSGEGHKSKLSLHSSNQDKSSERISINVLKCKNLKPPRPEGLTIYAKFDFNENSFSESPKYNIAADGLTDINYTASLITFTNDPNSLDDLAYKPIIVTLIEVLPKEKKQKEEKVQIIGQSTFDLLQIVKGETKLSLKLPVYPVPGSPLELQQQQQPELPLPELDVIVSVEQPLLSDEDLAKCNLVTVTLESLYSPPEPWNNATQPYAYTVSLPLPINDDKDNSIVFVNGLLRTPADAPSKQKRWGDTRGIQASSGLHIPNSFIAEDPVQEENGDLQTKEEKEHRVAVEKDKSRVTWNIERRCFLNAPSSASLRDQVLKTRFWPIEVIRTSVPTGVKGKKKVKITDTINANEAPSPQKSPYPSRKIKLDEEFGLSYHGVAYIDMAPLLYPGATRIRGAYKVYPYNETEFVNKTKRKVGSTDDTLKVVNYLFDRNLAATPSNKKDTKSGIEKKDPAKKGAKDANENEKHDPNSESQQYLEAKSFIMLEIKLDKPIIPRKPFDVLAKRVSELIPPRPKYPLRNNSAEKAVQDYHSQIKGIVNLVLDDYRKLFTSDSAIFQGSGSLEKYETIDVKRRKLLFELNATGKYFAFKEQLKNSVVKIVREKFFKTSALEDKDQMQTFLSELYVYLVDEMHKAINQIVSIEDLQPIPSEVADLQQMKHFAIEAEMNQNYDLASHYYQERIAREKDNYQNWLDYAAFNFLIEDYPRAEECLKECISINQHEISALLLYGVICTMQEKFEIAEVFFDRVTCNDNENVIAWCLYAMFYEQTNQELNAEISFNKTIKLNHALESLHEQNNNNVEEEHKIDENGDDVNLNKALDSHPKSRGSKRGTSQISKTKSELLKAPKSPATGSVLAPTQSVLGIKSPRSPTRLDDPSNGEQTRKSIFMKTAQFLIEYNAFTWAEKCLAKELVNPKGGPSCEFYVLLAKVKLSRNQLDEAEKNVCLALAIDYQSCEAWTLWGHLKYLIGEFQEAKEKYERVLQFPLLPTDQVHSIYIRLASIYLQEENFEDAKRLFLFACKNSPSCMSWLGVGICCYRLSQLEDSEDALSEANVLNNKAPEVWAYLSLICLKTNRPLEAEQAYKYAIKLNLDNQSLLDEIHALQEQVGFGHVEF